MDPFRDHCVLSRHERQELQHDAGHFDQESEKDPCLLRVEPLAVRYDPEKGFPHFLVIFFESFDQSRAEEFAESRSEAVHCRIKFGAVDSEVARDAGEVEL